MLKGLFATKSLEMLDAEAKGENRLRRILGTRSGLTSLGVGAIIGAGIFVMTGRVAANDAGPGILDFLCHRRRRLRPGGVLLCRIRLDGARRGQCLHLCLRHARRTFRLDHRLGFDSRIRHERAPRWRLPGRNISTNSCTGLSSWKVPDFLSNDPFTKAGLRLNLPAVLILAMFTFDLGHRHSGKRRSPTRCSCSSKSAS